MKKNIIVLGATGTVGRKIAQILINEGHHVTLVARHTETLETYHDQGAQIVAAAITDADQLTRAFTGADSAFILLPDNVKAENTRAYQRQVTGTLIEAIQRSGIRYIVNMSSLGSHMHEGNGIMGGTGEQEVRLNQLEGVNVVHIRSAYFMENFLRTIGLVKQAGINGTVAAANHAIPMVATRDVAQIAAGHLASLDFSGKSVHAVMGPRDYTYAELTSIIGAAIGKPDLTYVQLPVEQVRAVLLGNDFSPDFVNNLLEMGTAISTSYMNYQRREASTTTATTAEEFAREVYAPAFQR